RKHALSGLLKDLPFALTLLQAAHMGADEQFLLAKRQLRNCSSAPMWAACKRVSAKGKSFKRPDRACLRRVNHSCRPILRRQASINELGLGRLIYIFSASATLWRKHRPKARFRRYRHVP